MAITIKGIKAGTSTITASYGNQTATAKLTVVNASGQITYSLSSTTFSIYCTDTAAAYTTTNGAKSITVSTGATSTTGSITYTISVKNSSGSAVSGWTTDGKTITIPSGTDAGAYTISITATAGAVSGKYNSASSTKTATVTITATSISSYGAVSAPTITQKTNFPAGGVTLSSSNATTYFTGGTSSQTITYNNGKTRNGSISYSWSGSGTITSLGTTEKSISSVTFSQGITYTATGEGSKSASTTVTSGKQAANKEGTTHYKDTSGTEGDNWTYGTPSAVVVSGTDTITQHMGSCTLSSTATNVKQYYLKWTSGSYKSHSENVSASIGFKITAVSKNSGSDDFTLDGSTLSHRDMGTYVGKDTCTVQSYNVDATSKVGTAKSWGIQNDRTKNWGAIKSYGTPVAITIKSETSDTIAANGGSCTLVSSVTNVQYWYYTYTDSNHNEAVTAHTEEVAGTVEWVISSETTAVSGDRWSALSATSGTSTTVTHTTMGTTVGTDKLTLTARNKNSTSLAVTKSWEISNTLTWNSPVITCTTPVSLAAAGASSTMNPSITQSGSYTSGSTASNTTATYAYAQKEAVTGFSLSSAKVTAANNTTTSARSYVVTITATGSGSKTATKEITFNQSAGAKVYNTPTMTYKYSDAVAAGATVSPTCTQSQVWTWNGVSGSGGTLTSGGTYAYTYSSTPTGVTYDSSFSSNGKLTWSNNTSTSQRTATSVLSAKVTMNGKTSDSVTCSSCVQSAGAKVYAVPTISSYTYSAFAAGGATLTPNAVSGTQSYTWNGVSGSGSTDSWTKSTSGVTLSYSTTGTLPDGFTTGSDFSTTGSVAWASRGTTYSTDTRSAKSYLIVNATINGKKTSITTANCGSCDQNANLVTKLELTLTPSSIEYGATSTPTVKATYSSGSTNDVTASASYASSDPNVATIQN
jgi:hypothetical protein